MTDRTHVEEELRDSEERGRALFDNAAQAIISVDARGRIRRMNPMAERLFGYEAQEISGRALDVLMPDALLSRSPVTRRALARRAGRHPSKTGTFHALSSAPDTSLREVKSSSLPSDCNRNGR